MSPPISKMHKRVNAAASLKQNTFWDALHEFYQHACTVSMQTQAPLLKKLDVIVNNPELFNMIENKKAFNDDVLLLDKDADSYQTNIDAIYGSHKDRRGGIKTPEEGAQVIEINGKYQDAIEIYLGTIVPTIESINRHIDPIEKMVQQSKDEDDAKDVNVITDVEVKS